MCLISIVSYALHGYLDGNGTVARYYVGLYFEECDGKVIYISNNALWWSAVTGKLDARDDCLRGV